MDIFEGHCLGIAGVMFHDLTKKVDYLSISHISIFRNKLFKNYLHVAYEP